MYFRLFAVKMAESNSIDYEIKLDFCKMKGDRYVTPWKDFHLLNLSQLARIGFDYVAGSNKDSKPTDKTVSSSTNLLMYGAVNWSFVSMFVL